VPLLVLDELSQLGFQIRFPPTTGEQLRPVNIDCAVLASVVDLHDSVSQRLVSG
jgi:hypothetical protein